MEKASDTWKKYPLITMGAPPFAVPSLSALPLDAKNLPDASTLKDSYVLITPTEDGASHLLEQLLAASASADQIILLLTPQIPFQHPQQHIFGLMEWIEGEPAEEFRARLLVRLEAQRQKKLMFVMQEAVESGITRNLTESDLCNALDTVRVAHALACAYALSPALHAQALRACFDGSLNLSTPWLTDLPAEILIPQASAFLVDCATLGVNIREAFKERTAHLPFRVRSELLHHIEINLGFLLGGKSHAA